MTKYQHYRNVKIKNWQMLKLGNEVFGEKKLKFGIKVPNKHSTYGRVKVKPIQLFLGKHIWK